MKIKSALGVKSVLTSESGFSLMELMVALPVAVLVAATSAYVVTQTVKTQGVADFRISMHQAHLLKLQYFRNVAQLSKELNLPTNNPCFGKGSTTSCAGLASAGTLYNNSCIDSSVNDVKKCFMRYTLTYSVNCTAQRCSSVAFQLTTSQGQEALNAGYNVTPFVTSVTLPGFMFADRTAIDFSCVKTSSLLPIQIDYKNLVATCSAVTLTNSCSPNLGFPMTSFSTASATCDGSVSTVCPGSTGVTVAGLFSGQTVCN